MSAATDFALSLPSMLPASIGLGISGWGVLLFLLLGAVVLFFAFLAYRHTDPAVEGPGRWLLVGLRATALLLLLLMLAEPVLHQRREVRLAPSVLLLVDDSASMGIQSGDGSRRLDEALRLRQRTASALGQRDIDVWLGEGSSRLAGSRRDGSAPPAFAQLGEGTDLSALALSGAQRHLEDNLQAIVLFSDGIQTGGAQPSLGGLDLPVFTVAVGDTVGPADIKLDRVRYPSLAYRGEEVSIEGDLVAESKSAGSTRVRLSSAEGPLDSLDVRWPENGGRTHFSFTVPADSLGFHTLTLTADPLTEELLEENNQLQVGLEVRKDRLRVLFIEERPTWNFHFLARRAQKDPRFELIGVYRTPRGWSIAGTDSLWTPPVSSQQAAEYDAWAFGSISDFGKFAQPQGPLASSVEGGTGVLVFAGEPVGRRLPQIDGEAAQLLPLRPSPRAGWRLANHRARATAFGVGHPILSFPAELGSAADRLSAMPPLWAVAHDLELAADADEILQGQGGGATTPLLAVRRLGQGNIAMWTGAPLWSWSFWRLGSSRGEEVYDALVGNLLAFVAEGGDPSRLRLLMPRPVLATGEDARLRAVVLDPQMQPDGRSDVWLEWSEGSNVDSTRTATGRSLMNVDATTAGGRVLGVPPLPPGEYQLRLAMEEGERTVASAWKPLIIDPYSVEFQRTQIDAGTLADLGATTGGRTLTPDELESWARELPAEAKQATLGGRIDLWSSIWLLIPLLLVLTAEWSLRKRWGLI